MPVKPLPSRGPGALGPDVAPLSALDAQVQVRTSLQRPGAGGYEPIPCESVACAKLTVKEDDGERARALPLGEHVPGLPGRDLPGDCSPAPAVGRQPRSQATAPEAHRGQGCRRAAADAGRRPEGPPAHRRERRSRSRAAAAVLRELSHRAALPAAFVAGAVGLAGLAAACDIGTQTNEPSFPGGTPIHLVAAN